LRNGDGSPEAALEQGENSDGAGDRFQAAAVAAAADRPVWIREHMADLARHAEAALIRLAVDDEAGSAS
jgi:hypothetical protein